METQNETIIGYLNKHPEGITPHDALQFGCMRLASRIKELRIQGNVITTLMCSKVNKSGRIVKFARYILEETAK